MKWPFSKHQHQAAEDTLTAADGQAAVRDLVRALPDPALVVDISGLVTIANDQARAALDRNPVGHHLSATIRAPSVLEAVTAAIAGEASHQVELELRIPMARSFDIYVSPFGAQGVILIFKDLTREQQIERMRADFVANASHELRTPLAALSGFIETMQGAARNDEAAREKHYERMLALYRRHIG